MLFRLLSPPKADASFSYFGSFGLVRPIVEPSSTMLSSLPGLWEGKHEAYPPPMKCTNCVFSGKNELPEETGSSVMHIQAGEADTGVSWGSVVWQCLCLS